MPILFHEMAHQFKLGESEANALQKLADLQLEYRPIFVSAYVGRAICAQASQNFDAKEKFSLILYTEGSSLPSINTFGGERAAKSSLMRCGANATATYRGLDALTQKISLVPSSTLTAKEKSDLLAFAKVPRKDVFDLDAIMDVLTEGSMSEYDREAARERGFDTQYIISTASKAVIELVYQDVGRGQDAIVLK